MIALQIEELAELKVRFKKLLDEQYQDNRRCQTHPKDFRFIIFSGEALPSEFLKIRDAVIEVVPAFSDKCRDEIDPHWVAAIGAAEQAKEYVLNPPVRRIGGMTEEGRKQAEERDDEFRRLRGKYPVERRIVALLESEDGKGSKLGSSSLVGKLGRASEEI